MNTESRDDVRETRSEIVVIRAGGKRGTGGAHWWERGLATRGISRMVGACTGNALR